MPAQVDRLEYVLGMDDREFRTKAKAAEKQVTTMSGTIKKNLGGIAAAFTGAFAATAIVGEIRKISAAAGEYIKMATLTAARNEELQMVMHNVGKTAGYAASYLDQQEGSVKKLGITTSNTRGMIIRLMQAQIDLGYATKLARAAQDLAVISGQNTAEAVADLTDAIAAQRPMLLRQFGIVMDLGDIYSRQAKLIGKSTNELNEYEKRLAFVNVILEQAARVQGTYETAMQTAGKQLRSLPRYFEELAAKVGTVFLPVFGEMIGDITTGTKQIDQALAENQASVARTQQLLLKAYAGLKLWAKTLGFVFEKGLRIDEVIADLERLSKEIYELPIPKAKIETWISPKAQAEWRKWIEFSKEGIKELSDAHLDHMLWKLDLDRRYEKISLAQFKAHLKDILVSYQVNADQKEKIERQIASATYDIERQRNKMLVDERQRSLELLLQYEKITLPQYVAILKQGLQQFKTTEDEKLRTRFEILSKMLEMEQTVNYMTKERAKEATEFGLASNEQIAEDTLALLRGEIELEEWKAGRKRAIRQKELMEIEQQHGLLFAAYDTFWRSLYDLDMTGSERRKAIWESMYRYMIDQGMGFVKAEIKNELLRQSVKEGAAKSELAIYTKAVATKMALMAKESWAAISAAAKWIYNAAAKIFAAHAHIPWAGVGIASGFVAAMMAVLAKLKKFEAGGLVEGLDRGRDKIGALLTAGEYVMPKRAVQSIGVPTLDYMRQTGAAAQPVVVHVDMGGMSFNRMDRSDSFFIETSVIDRVTEAVKEAIRQGKLEI